MAKKGKGTTLMIVPKDMVKEVKKHIERVQESRRTVPLNRDKLAVNKKQLAIAWERARQLASALKPITKQADKLHDVTGNLSGKDEQFLSRQIDEIEKLYSYIDDLA